MPPSRIGAKALSRFSQDEKIQIHDLLTAKAKRSEAPQASHTAKASESQGGQEKTKHTASCEQIEALKLVRVEIEGEYFLIDEKIQARVQQEVTKLYNQNEIKGDAAKKPLQTLLSEIYFSISTRKASLRSQNQQCWLAINLCKRGNWQTPHAYCKRAIIQREQAAHQRKIQEAGLAKSFITHVESELKEQAKWK